MSQEYNMYLEQHRSNVRRAYEWLKTYLFEVVTKDSDFDISDYEFQITIAHDESKDDLEEYDAYDAYFYGRNRSYQVVQDFNYAWLRHIHRNPHHWQYWVLNNDDPSEGEIVLDMPYNYIIEMICDWWAFSWNSGDLTTIFKWYDEHKDYIKLSKKTRETVEDILERIKEKLSELNGDQTL